MNTENNECSQVQENIAWGRSLSKSDQDHILSSSKCGFVAIEFEEIDSVIKNAEVFVPREFVDVVMGRLEKYEKSKTTLNLTFKEYCMILFDRQIFRWGIGGTSFLLAFSAH